MLPTTFLGPQSWLSAPLPLILLLRAPPLTSDFKESPLLSPKTPSRPFPWASKSLPRLKADLA